MRFIITPYIADLMQERKRFVILYSKNKILTDGQLVKWEHDNPNSGEPHIVGFSEEENYYMHLTTGVSIWVPYNIISNGYSSIREYIKTLGIELAA